MITKCMIHGFRKVIVRCDIVLLHQQCSPSFYTSLYHSPSVGHFD
jgi:hypothetical protein